MPAATPETRKLKKVLLLLFQERLTCHQIGKAAKPERQSRASPELPSCLTSLSDSKVATVGLTSFLYLNS